MVTDQLARTLAGAAMSGVSDLSSTNPGKGAALVKMPDGSTVYDKAIMVKKVIRPQLIPAETMNDTTGLATPAAQAARAANTVALRVAIATAKGYAAQLPGYAPSRGMRIPEIVVDPGVYAFSDDASFLIDFQGFTIRAATRHGTTFLYGGSSPFIDIGTFSTTPADIFGGQAQSYTICDLAIFNPVYLSTSNHGSRSGSAIRDSGCGTGTIKDVRIGGYAYGINFPYGSDFTTTTRCYIELCDVGLYAGPGCQQQLHTNLVTYLCQEPHVLDRPGHIVFDMPVVVGPKMLGFTFECPTHSGGTGSTRQISSFSTSSIFMDGKAIIRHPWLESDPGGIGDVTIPDHFVGFKNCATNYFGIDIIKPIVVAGSTATRWPTSLCGVYTGAAQPQWVTIERPTMHGKMAMWMYNPGNNWLLKDPKVAAGYTDIIISGSSNANATSEIAGGGRLATAYPIRRAMGISSSTAYSPQNYISGVRESITAGGLISYADAVNNVWTERMGIDVARMQVVHGDPAAASSPRVGYSAAMPTTGSFGAGSIVYNSAPAAAAGKILFAWSRLTTGSNHVAGTDWQPLYATIS